MIRHINSTDLKQLIHNYTHNKDLPVYTNWGVLVLEELIPFLTKARDDLKANAVAIALIRFPFDDAAEASITGDRHMKTVGLGLSQVAFALVTGKATVTSPWTMKAQKDGNTDQYEVLFVCEPDRTLLEDPYGLCPPQGDEIEFPGT